MQVWFSVLRRNPFIFNYASEIAMKSNYYAVYKDVLSELPKITLNTTIPHISIPGFTYKNFNPNNYVFG